MLEELKLDKDGLIPDIIQDHENNEVLMMAFMNREALQKTMESGHVCFWSRSRQEYWIKGETSGHTQTVKSVAFDCDGDALLIKVEQKGGACHVGYRSCFFREVTSNGNSSRIVGEKVFNPDEVYS
ncbi:MAG: phosphoribosyl-AMP cyclohydrolase [Candidatus Poribacteria bacterium]|nr:phosphoribosyl-AMP cyclohydrolase [Candidatus Poribacteria bacterium]